MDINRLRGVRKEIESNQVTMKTVRDVNLNWAAMVFWSKKCVQENDQVIDKQREPHFELGTEPSKESSALVCVIYRSEERRMPRTAHSSGGGLLRIRQIIGGRAGGATVFVVVFPATRNWHVLLVSQLC